MIFLYSLYKQTYKMKGIINWITNDYLKIIIIYQKAKIIIYSKMEIPLDFFLRLMKGMADDLELEDVSKKIKKHFQVEEEDFVSP